MQETDQEGEVSQLFRVFDIEGTGLIGWWIANKDNVENVTKKIKFFSDVEEFGKVMMKLPVVIRNEELKVRMRTKTKNCLMSVASCLLSDVCRSVSVVCCPTWQLVCDKQVAPSSFYVCIFAYTCAMCMHHTDKGGECQNETS